MKRYMNDMDIFFFIGINIFSRITPHIPNMTPIGAVTLFTASRYSFRKSFLILVVSMLATDAVLGFHPVMWATYTSLYVSLLIGRVIPKTRNWKIIGIVTVISSSQFFIFTNFAVWFTGLMYPKTFEGLIECYFRALPFFRNSLFGDLFYTAIIYTLFFYGKQIKRRIFPREVLV
jgi:hypothetical protein